MSFGWTFRTVVVCNGLCCWFVVNSQRGWVVDGETCYSRSERGRYRFGTSPHLAGSAGATTAIDVVQNENGRPAGASVFVLTGG